MRFIWFIPLFPLVFWLAWSFGPGATPAQTAKGGASGEGFLERQVGNLIESQIAEIPDDARLSDQDLVNFRRQCVASSRGQGATDRQIQAYCGCMADGVRDGFTQKEFMRMTMGMIKGAVSGDEEKMTQSLMGHETFQTILTGCVQQAAN